MSVAGVPTPPAVPDHRPRFPDGPRPAIGIPGCGQIAQSAHLPAYAAHGLEVAGVWSRTPATTATVRERSGVVGQVYPSAEDLLADPAVGIVDIATGPEDRLRSIAAALRAGEHVLAQKPPTLDLPGLAPLLATARERGLRVAVDQNARWAPPFRLATPLVADGAVGDVVGVTHLHDEPLPPIAGTPFDDVPHMLVADYLVHRVDITRCWLEGKGVRSTLERGATATTYAPDGQWFVDGFAGVMGEPMCAVAEGREPSSSAAHDVASLELVLAAGASAAADGAVVPTPGLSL